MTSDKITPRLDRFLAAEEITRAVDALRTLGPVVDPATATMLRDRYDRAVREYDRLSGRDGRRRLVGADPGNTDVMIRLMFVGDR